MKCCLCGIAWCATPVHKIRHVNADYDVAVAPEQRYLLLACNAVEHCVPGTGGLPGSGLFAYGIQEKAVHGEIQAAMKGLALCFSTFSVWQTSSPCSGCHAFFNDSNCISLAERVHDESVNTVSRFI